MATIVTKTIRSSGGDYTSLANWESAQQGDLVSADEVRVAECYDDWPSGASNVDVGGSTTDATRYRMITVAEGHRHDGISHDSGFWIKPPTFNVAIGFSEDYVIAEWVAIGLSINYTSCATVGNANYCVGRNLLGVVVTTQASLFGFRVAGAVGYSRSGTFHTCVARGFNQTNCVAFAINDSSDNTGAFYNCVSANNWVGFAGGASCAATIKNCVAYNNTTNYSGSWLAASTNNATSTGSDDAPGDSSVYGVTSAAFANAAGNDFHLSGASSVLYNVGADLSGIFTIDIDGDTWVNWSIGVDQIDAAVNPFVRDYAPDNWQLFHNPR